MPSCFNSDIKVVSNSISVGLEEDWIQYSFWNAYLSFLEKFFEMKKGQCKDALEIYKRFLTRMTRVSEFLKVAEVSNINSYIWSKQ